MRACVRLPGSSTSRRRNIDQSALTDALKSGAIGGAYLDVTEPEPLPKEDELWELDNVIITPHSSWTSPHFDRRSAQLFLTLLDQFRAGEEMSIRSTSSAATGSPRHRSGGGNRPATRSRGAVPPRRSRCAGHRRQQWSGATIRTGASSCRRRRGRQCAKAGRLRELAADDAHVHPVMCDLSDPHQGDRLVEQVIRRAVVSTSLSTTLG